MSNHPSSNGMIERFHHQLKAALHAYPDQQRWSEYVPIVLLGCHAAIKEDLGYSPAELVYRVPLSLPGQLLNPIDLTATDPFLYTNRLRAPTTAPQGTDHQIIGPKRHFFVDSRFSKKGRCESASHSTLHQALSRAFMH